MSVVPACARASAGRPHKVGWLVTGTLLSVLPLGILAGASERLATGAALLAPIMWAPLVWWFLDSLSRPGRPVSVVSIALGAFLIGACRSCLTCYWVLYAAPSALAAFLVGSVWIGFVHCVFAVTYRFIFSRFRFGGYAICFLIPAMDWVLCDRWLLPTPYLTSVYAAAESRFVLLAPWIGPYGLSSMIGFFSFFVATRWRNHGIRSGLLSSALVIALCQLAPQLVFFASPNAPSKTRPDIPILAIGNPRAISTYKSLSTSKSAMAADPSLIILRESSVIDGPQISGAEGELTLAELKDFQAAFPSSATIIAGALLDLGDNAGSYRKGIIFLSPEHKELFRDKRVPVPGCEVTPFACFPFIATFVDRYWPGKGRLIQLSSSYEPVEVSRLRIASAVCFEHALIDPSTAWGIARPGRTDLLIAVAKLQALGSCWKIEHFQSRAARCLQAALLQTTLVYVTDFDVEVVTPDASFQQFTYSENGTKLLNTSIQASPPPFVVDAMRWSRLLMALAIGASLIVPFFRKRLQLNL